MLIEHARGILATIPTDRSQKQRLFRGLQILTQYDENVHYSFRSDQLFCADFTATAARMNQEEVEEMAKLGWFEAEEAWSLFS